MEAQIVAPSETVVSINGVVVRAQQNLAFVRGADAVLFGSGRRSAQQSEDAALMGQLILDPSRQLIGSQCSGALFLHRLGLVAGIPVCTDNSTRALLRAAGLTTLDKHFDASANIATAGGCLASPCLAAWVIDRLAGRAQTIAALRYVAPVGSEDMFVHDVLSAIGPAAQDALSTPDETMNAPLGAP